MGERSNFVGQIFGQLTVIVDAGNNKKGQSTWRCICTCGKTTVVDGAHLPSGHTTSCGCRQGRFIHGQSRTKKLSGVTREYKLWNAARSNSRKKGWDCTLRLSDIHIPEFCPVFGIALDKNALPSSDNLPSLDRVDNRLKYTLDNIWVISWKANQLKGRATVEELKLLVSALTKASEKGEK